MIDIVLAILVVLIGLLVANWRDDMPKSPPKVCHECGHPLAKWDERCHNCGSALDVDR